MIQPQLSLPIQKRVHGCGTGPNVVQECEESDIWLEHVTDVCQQRLERAGFEACQPCCGIITCDLTLGPILTDRRRAARCGRVRRMNTAHLASLATFRGAAYGVLGRR